MTAGERLAALSPAARASATAALDEISRPLDVGEIDVALARAGIPRSKRRPVVRALMEAFDIIALEPNA
ncbi:hypothetical protein [Stakelama marina]|uniref:Uncharacterized protein n=1 Tax=Stakelama marina TaxID=2826939 RepID=A0A8T4IHG3_9SPHN|nr:hypothetical protein [Stakelama marina]MBR0551739.1 hypothetical protein [Stakelama marina]